MINPVRAVFYMISMLNFSGSGSKNQAVNSKGDPLTAEESILTKRGAIKSYQELSAGQKKALDAFVRQQVQDSTPFGRKLGSFFLKPHLEKLLRRTASPSSFQALPYNISMAVYRNPKALHKAPFSPADEVYSRILHGKAGIPLKMNGQFILNSALRNNHPFVFQRALASLKCESTQAERELLNQKDGLGLTPFYTAIVTRHIPEAIQLVKMGANPFIADPEGQTALGLLAKYGEVDAMKELLRATDWKIMQTHAVDAEALKREAKTNKARIDQLVKDYKNQNLSSEAKQTLLWRLCKSDTLNAGERAENTLRALALARLGTNLNALDEDGYPLLFSAALMGHADLVSALILAGAKVNQVASNGWIPLNGALMPGDSFETVRRFIQAGADIHHVTGSDSE